MWEIRRMRPVSYTHLFAVDWYLKAEQEQMKQGENAYSDEQYDHALYLAIQKAEDYLQPFFKYDLGKIYAIAWDCEENGGLDGDRMTLAVRKENGQAQEEAASAVSKYLPYGEYVIVEEPVSYTHLDVYKRQGLDLQPICERRTGKDFLVPFCG